MSDSYHEILLTEEALSKSVDDSAAEGLTTAWKATTLLRRGSPSRKAIVTMKMTALTGVPLLQGQKLVKFCWALFDLATFNLEMSIGCLHAI